MREKSRLTTGPEFELVAMHWYLPLSLNCTSGMTSSWPKLALTFLRGIGASRRRHDTRGVGLFINTQAAAVMTSVN